MKNEKQQEQQEQSISLEGMKEFSDRYVTKKTTNAEIFFMVRGLFDTSLGNNTKLTNIGSMYWYLMETRDLLKEAS